MHRSLDEQSRIKTVIDALIKSAPETKFKILESISIVITALNQLCWRHSADVTGGFSVAIPILLLINLAIVNWLPVASQNRNRLLHILIELVLLAAASFMGTHRAYRELYFLVIGKASLILNKKSVLAVLSIAIIQQLAFVYIIQKTPPRSVLMFPSMLPRQAIMSAEYVINYVFFILLIVLVSLLLRSEQNARQKAEQLKLEMDSLTLQLERERIARDIHDSLGHALTGLNVQLQLAQKLETIDRSRSHDAIALARGFASRAAADVRRAVRAVRDSHFDFPAAVAELVEGIQSGGTIKMKVSICPLVIPSQLSHNLFFLIQESLTNVQRHSKATEVVVELTNSEDICLLVKDNGTGFSNQDITPGFGIKGMEERVASLGGTIKMISENGMGTEIRIVIPNTNALERSSDD